MNEKVAAIVRAWPQWSRAERERMDDVIEEVLEHCRNGTGNKFIASLCDRNLAECFA